MNKVLIVFLYRLEKKKELNEIVNGFTRNGYQVFYIDDIKVNFDIKSLPLYVDDVQNCLNLKLDRITVLSNIKEFIFTWYRAYNSLVDDFIYFIDGKNYGDQFFNNNIIKDNLYLQILNFIGINDESIQGKIFLNLDLNNYKKLYNFLFLNNNFQYFNILSNFDYNRFTPKKIVKKTYKYKGFPIEFYLQLEDCKEELIDISGDFQTNIKLDLDLVNLLIENPYFIDKIVIELYEKIDLDKIRPFLLTLFKSLKNADEDSKNYTFNNIINYCEKEEVDFLMKVGLLSLIVIVKPEEEIVLKLIMKTLLDDYKYIKYHYAILTNTLLYLSTDNIKMYDNYYVDRRKIRDKITGYIKKEIDLVKQNNSNEKYIAIIAHQFLSILHSPTKMTVKYLNYLKKEFPEYKIKIFVEDVFAHNKSEVVLPYFYSSCVGKSLEKTHLEYLHEDIEVYYSNPRYSRKRRTIDLVEKINKFNPELVWAFGPMSIALDILYDYYPTLYISMNTDSYFVESVDVHMYKDKGLVLEKNEKYNLIDENNIYNRILINTHENLKPYKNIKRSDYAIKEYDFVLITVGNRLDTEMDSNFLDYICSFLLDREDVKWIIVGKTKLNYIKKNHSSLLKNQIIRISYEKDLSALYKICDAYINPVRSGGGASVAIAINQRLPVVTLSEVSDATTVTGMDNGAGTTLDEYIKELELLYKDKNYRKKKIKLMEKRLKELNYKNGVREFLSFFEIAKKNFNQRIKYK